MTFERLKSWARVVKRDTHALFLASRDPRVPWYAKALAVVLIAYALSPIDLIPDFIPVLGLVDDAILLPLGIMLVVRLIPPEVMEEHRRTVNTRTEMPRGRAGAVTVILIWCACIGAAGWFGYRFFAAP